MELPCRMVVDMARSLTLIEWLRTGASLVAASMNQ
jgi:hypothetical protein